MDASERTPLDFGSGIGGNPTSQVYSAAEGDSEESGSIDAISPGVASNDPATVEADAPVPGITGPVPLTSNTKVFPEARRDPLYEDLHLPRVVEN